MYRALEEAIIARETQEEELRALRLAIVKVEKRTNPLTVTFALAHASGVKQIELAEMSGYSPRQVRRNIAEFLYWLRIVYRRPE